MSIFQRQNTIIVQFDIDRKVNTLRLNEEGVSYLTDDMERFGFEQGTNLSDMEIAELVRGLKEEGIKVKIQKYS